MNKKLGLAVAGALVAFSSAANAGITIPAGDWTVDLGGNVNSYYSNTSVDSTTKAGVKTSPANANTVTTGLLPAAIGIGAKTRQNDLDIAVQFTFFTGTSAAEGKGYGTANSVPGAGGNNSLNIRQAFMSFGDASWGSVKMGRDLGVFGSDAILSDMTLLGVGTGAGTSGNSTLGRIGSGYIYADWIGQIQYTSPNWNGFQVTGAIREPWSNGNDNTQHNLGFDGKATYDFAANDVTGRVWVGGMTQQIEDKAAVLGVAATAASGTVGTTGYVASVAGTSGAAAVPGFRASAGEVGAKVSYQGVQLVGYYYSGEGNGRTVQLGVADKSKDSGGYVQATFVVPGIGTKLGASWGQSETTNAAGTIHSTNESWIVGAYHPLTKSLNLVAEYTDQRVRADGTGVASTDVAAKDVNTVSLGAILFF